MIGAVFIYLYILLNFFEQFLAGETAVAGDLVVRNDAQLDAVVAGYKN